MSTVPAFLNGRMSPYIIAEVGSNWHTFEDIAQSIRAAKNAGADAVKFQYFHAHDLYGPNAHAEHDRVLKLAWFDDMKAIADRAGIDFLCTAFSEVGYDVVDMFVPYHKIASAESTHVPLIKHVLSKRKPIFISFGGAFRSEIQAIRDKVLSGDNVVGLYCVPNYPSTDHFTRSVSTLADIFTYVGFSDHSLDVLEAPLRAVEEGACVIEKHFRLPHITRTPDFPHSITPCDLKRMIDSIRNDAWKDEGFFDTSDFRQQAVRAAIATKPILQGQTFKYGSNYGFFRPRTKKHLVTRINGTEMELIEGKRSSSLVDTGELITTLDVVN